MSSTNRTNAADRHISRAPARRCTSAGSESCSPCGNGVCGRMFDMNWKDLEQVRERHRAYERKYRASHRERCRKRSREGSRFYRAKYPEKVLNYNRKYNASHREQIRERERKRRTRQPEKVRQWHYNWRIANPERYRKLVRKRVDKLRPHYVRQLLAHNTLFKPIQIPDSLVILKIKYLKLKRQYEIQINLSK